MIEIEKRRLKLNKTAKPHQPSRRKRKIEYYKEDCDYGNQTCQQLDKSPEEYAELRIELLNKLKKEADDAENIERSTLEQSSDPKWHEIRMYRLTASKFGEICRSRNTKFLKNKVANILYKNSFYSKPIMYGTENEQNAIEQFSRENNIKVSKCGVFIYKKFPCLAASPDGLVGNNGIVEVKCPYNARELCPLEAVKLKIIKCLTYNKLTDNVTINQNHPYYYQIQGQLEIINRDYCYFIIWTPKGLIYLDIQRNSDFFYQHMLQKLLSFYFNCLIKEIIDGRRQRNMPIRDFPEDPEMDFTNLFT